MICGMEPVAAVGARILVLGTIPGLVSLETQRYYANERNAFWTIAGRLLGVPREQPYEARVAQLTEAGIALWDVLAAAERTGSLDSAIVRGTEVPNDLADFLSRHRQIENVFLNGTKAGSLFRRLLEPQLRAAGAEVAVRELPSTSPANTRLTLEATLTAWAEVADALHGTSRANVTPARGADSGSGG